MKFILQYIFIICSLLLVCCEPPPIPLELDPPPTKLVVSSHLIPDGSLVVVLTRSFGTLEGMSQRDSLTGDFLKKILVADALVTVSYSQKTDTLDMIQPGVYSTRAALPNQLGTYALFAKDYQTGEMVRAISQRLPKVEFEQIQPVITHSDDESSLEIKYSFNDDPAVRNWYLINYYQKVSVDKNNVDINTLFQWGSNKKTQFDIISDESFKDPYFIASRKLEEITLSDTIGVSISSISQGYFEFLSLYKRSSNLINRLSGEPIDYPTNVENGYGYFTTHDQDLRLFDLKKY